MTNAEVRNLVEKARGADGLAETALFDLYVVPLTRVTRSRLSRRLNHRVDAEDIVQSAYITFFRCLRNGRYEFHTSSDVWRFLVVMAIRTVNRQVHQHTARKRSIHSEQSWAAQFASRHWPPDTVAPGLSPDAAAAIRDELRYLIAARPATHRAIIELRLGGQPICYIARSVPCCHRTVHRVLAKFRQELSERYPVPSSAAPNLAPAARARGIPRDTSG